MPDSVQYIFMSDLIHTSQDPVPIGTNTGVQVCVLHTKHQWELYKPNI